jgi:hypothetical protein
MRFRSSRRFELVKGHAPVVFQPERQPAASPDRRTAQTSRRMPRESHRAAARSGLAKAARRRVAGLCVTRAMLDAHAVIRSRANRRPSLRSAGSSPVGVAKVCMPTVLRVEGFRFFFFSNEGTEPPHIHVEHGDAHAKFWLDTLLLAYSTGMTARELRRARELVAEHAQAFKDAWLEHFRS